MVVGGHRSGPGFPWARLAGVGAFRITEIPRGPESGTEETAGHEDDDPGRSQRVAALVAAYHAGIGGAADFTANGTAANGTAVNAVAADEAVADGAVGFGWVRME